jgi:hypothetical protein
MARFNEILVGRYNRFLQKLFSMKGGPVASQLASEISTVFPFFNGAENRALEGWSRFHFRESVAAIAGVQGASRLRNPVGSNVVAVFERITATGALADNPLLEQQQTSVDLSIIAQPVQERMDPRGQNSSVLIRSTTTATPGSLFLAYQINYPANSSADFIIDQVHEIPLLPGDAIQVEGGNNNQQIIISWLWRERFLEDSERT